MSTDQKNKTYNSILVIVDQIIKMLHYKPVKITIDALSLAEVIFNEIMHHHGLSDSIKSDQESVFTLKFQSSLYSFLGIKRHLIIVFHTQTNIWIKQQNSTMEAQLRAFFNFKQNNWAELLPMAGFAYNNAKNKNTSHTPFELNCEYHLFVSYEKDIDFYS